MGGKAALILVVGFGMIFGYIGVRINELESRAVGNSATYLEVTTSHSIAVTGANVALAKLYQDTLLWTRPGPPGPGDTLLSAQSFSTGPFAGGSFDAWYDWLSPVSLRIFTTSQYWAYGHTWRDTVIVNFRKVGVYDILGYQTGFRGNDDMWISKDSMWGRVHFNGRIHVRGSPVYNDKATFSKGMDPPHGTSTNQAVFLNGYETGLNQIPIPQISDTADTWPWADTVINNPTVSVKFVNPTALNNDGFAEIRTGGLHSWGGAPDKFYLHNLRPNKVILILGDVSVKGTVDGQVTLGATGRIFVDSNIVCARDPQVFSGSDDMLGLVCIGDFVLYNQPAAGHTDWKVQVVAASLDGALISQNQPNGWYGAFRLFGGLITRSRTEIADYDMNTGSNPYMKGGFYRRIRWDPRMGPPPGGTNMRPPHFPVPDDVPLKLQLANWWENVRVPPF